MKKSNLVLLLIAFATIFNVSCSKYQDGPAFSLLTKKSRLEGVWTMKSVTLDGQDITQNFLQSAGQNFSLEIEKDGTYRTTGSSSEKGTWELGEDKDDIRFTPTSGSSDEESYRILRLTSTELWLRSTLPTGQIIVQKLIQ